MKFKLIDEAKTHHTVSHLSRALGVSRAGYHVYDPLYREYAPLIEILVKKDVMWTTASEDEPRSYERMRQCLLFELQRLTALHQERISIAEAIKQRDKLKELRKLLSFQRAVWHDAPNTAVSQVRRELRRIAKHIRKIASRADWSLWATAVLISLPLVAAYLGTEAAL